MIKVSDYVMEFLKQKGVTCAFMLPGGGAMHLVDSLGRSGMEYVCFQHEQGASIAAEAYAQHTNAPGFVLVTSGPGATNAITGVTAGWIDSTPMFVISGQSKRADLVGEKKVRQIGSQEVQIIPMIKPITKYAVQVMEPSGIRYHLERAWHECTSGRPGPVWLSIPLDVQGASIDEDSLEGYEPGKKEDICIEEDIKKIIGLLKESKKPLVFAGNGIKLAGGEKELYRLLDLLKIPVETTWKTIDMFGEDEKCYAGHPGIMGDRGANLILQEADFILSIGCRLDTSVTAFNEKAFGKSAKKVIVDIDENEIRRMEVEKEVAVCCDAKVFLETFLEYFEKEKSEIISSDRQNSWGQWLVYCRNLRKQYPVITEEHRSVKEHVSAYYFIGELCRLLRNDDVIVPESSGGAGEITYQAFRLKKGQKMKNAAGLGSMGFGLPYAIGSCIANGRRRTILINGDGAFQLNIQELETLHRLKLPVKIFIWYNSGYASIRSMQRNNFEGRYVASGADSGFTVPDICKVAEAYGFVTCRINNNEELDRLLPDIMKDDEPVLCEVMVLPEETVSPRVKAQVQPDGGMRSGELDKMWPYVN